MRKFRENGTWRFLATNFKKKKVTSNLNVYISLVVYIWIPNIKNHQVKEKKNSMNLMLMNHKMSTWWNSMMIHINYKLLFAKGRKGKKKERKRREDDPFQEVTALWVDGNKILNPQWDLEFFIHRCIYSRSVQILNRVDPLARLFCLLFFCHELFNLRKRERWWWLSL